MTEPLVDPLLPLLRPGPAAPAPMLLSRTDLQLWLAPGSARLRVLRCLSNHEVRPTEAVLTVPPALDGERIFAAAVTVGTERWTATAHAHRSSETAYDGAAVEGQRAFFLEEAKHGWRVLSIAGIEPGEEIAIEIDSVVELGGGTCDLLLYPATDGHRSILRLPDHQTPQLTGVLHPMTLTVQASAGIEVSLQGMPVPTGRAQSIDGAPLALRVTTAPDASPSDPHLPEEHAAVTALAAARRIEQLLAGSKPIDRTAVRTLALSANLLTTETSLVFIGPHGEASGVLPTMRKVALFTGRSSAMPEPPPLPLPPALPRSDVEWHGTEPPEMPGRPDAPRPGRSRRFWPRLAFPEAPLPWTVQFANWLRHRLRRRPGRPTLAELGRRMRDAAPLVLWSRDGVLALRSGDAGHLPESAASLMRETAADPDVVATASALRLPAEQLAIGLLAGAAIKEAVAPQVVLATLFPEDPASPPLPFQRLLARMHLG